MPLHMLDDDVLARVVSLVPPPQCDDWIFLALANRAFARAVARAFAAKEREWLTERRLPGLDGVVDSTSKRMASSCAGVMVSPHRFAYAQKHLSASLGTFFVAPHILVLRTVPVLRASDFIAARNLSLQALFYMLRSAPETMIRGSFFEVLGGGEGRRLVLSTMHHRALVVYAAFFGRIDILDWLVHRDPNRARGYDYAEGLTQLFTHDVLRMYAGNEKPPPEAAHGVSVSGYGRQPTRPTALISFREVQALIAKPAVIGNQPAVLRWLDETLRILCKRGGLCMTRFTVHNLQTTLKNNFLGQALRYPNIDYPAPPLTDNSAAWKAFHDVIVEASAAGSVAVLDAFASAILESDAPASSQYQLRGFCNLGLFTMLITLLHGDRVGASHLWLVAFCKRHGTLLRSLALLNIDLSSFADHVFGTHASIFGAFDLEDLMWVCESQLSFFKVASPDGLLAVGIFCRSLRERLVALGDAAYTRWLLNEFDETVAAHSLVGVDRGWFSRTISCLNIVFTTVRDRIAPARLSVLEALCLYLTAALRTKHDARATPLSHHLHATLEYVPTTIHEAATEPNHLIRGTSVMLHRHPWLLRYGFYGGTTVCQAIGIVLEHWVVHTLSKDAQVEWPLKCWMQLIGFAPTACYGALAGACDRLATKGLLAEASPDAERTRARHRLGFVLADAAAGCLMRSNKTFADGHRTCAVGFLHLLVKHNLVDAFWKEELLAQAAKTTPECETAFAAALRHTH